MKKARFGGLFSWLPAIPVPVALQDHHLSSIGVGFAALVFAATCVVAVRRDWRALIQYGAIFFGLEKLGAVVGVSNLDIYSAMRGQTLEEFQKTRNQQVLYGVARKS